jgi:cell division protein FtsL
MVAILLVCAIVALVQTNAKIRSVENEKILLAGQVDAQIVRNSELRDAIENSADPEHQKDIAREKLGLLEPGEKVFHITD